MEPTFTSRAIAYLKADVSKERAPAVSVSHEDSPIFRLLSDGLCICYVVDHENAYHYIQQRHISEDGISEEQLHEIGLRNLTELASKRDLRVQPHQNIFGVLMGGDFESSLILLDQLWEQQFRQFVPGDYAVAVPNRDILAFCDSTSKTGLIELRQLIAKIHKTGDHPISDKIYVRRGNRWSPYGLLP
jgi:uncharacterized protein YtpQ (UPF0354 family)